MTEWIAAMAIRQFSEWRRQGLDLIVSINISTASLHDGSHIARPLLPGKILELIRGEVRPLGGTRRRRRAFWTSRSARKRHSGPEAGMETGAVVSLMFYFVIPLWLLAGVADWICHRVSDIQHTTGAKESIIHLLMFAEAGTALIAALFLEINALIIALIIVMFVLHEATGWWGIGYASTRREITHYEQHAHSFLEVTPLMAALLVVVLHWGQFLALFGFGPETARFTVGWKSQPLPLVFSLGTVAAAVLLEIAPYSEELWRCLRAAHGRLIPARSAQKH